MSENEIKPVDGVIPARKFDGQLWIPADVAIELRSKDRAAIDRLTAERDAAVADRDALSTMLAVAGGRLEEAANEIEDWGAYADEYFQKKHLLAEVVQSFRDDAKDAADAARAEGRA